MNSAPLLTSLLPSRGLRPRVPPSIKATAELGPIGPGSQVPLRPGHLPRGFTLGFPMTDFKQEFRHYCRNPHCRSKLPAPVSNPREAFCAAGCHSSFYLKRCLICEGPIDRRNARQRVCRKSKCRAAFRGRSGLGRYLLSSSAASASKTPDSIDSKPAPKTDRAWYIVAGPPLTPSQLHCATVPDGPDGRWEGGEFYRIEAKNRAALKAAEQAEIEANGYFTDPEWREVISPDGVKCFVTRFATPQKQPRRKQASPLIPDDLSIPAFLRLLLPQTKGDRTSGHPWAFFPYPRDERAYRHARSGSRSARGLTRPIFFWKIFGNIACLCLRLLI
jgi:hypothetical protein